MEQLRIRLCDSEPELLLNVLFEGGSCVGVTVEFRVFVLLSFYTCRWDDAEGAGMPCGEIVHDGCVGSVCSEH